MAPAVRHGGPGVVSATLGPLMGPGPAPGCARPAGIGRGPASGSGVGWHGSAG